MKNLLALMCSIVWGIGPEPVQRWVTVLVLSPPFLVDTAVVSMYNEGLEAMPMEENFLLVCGLLGVVIGVLECIKGE